MTFNYTVTVVYGANDSIADTQVIAKNENHAIGIVKSELVRGGIKIKSITAKLSEDLGDSSTVDSVLTPSLF